MTTITIREVPAETVQELRLRATRFGLSLEDYLRAQIIALCASPDVDGWLDNVSQHRTVSGAAVSTGAILDALATDRR